MHDTIKKAALVYLFKKYGGLNKKALDRNPAPTLSLDSPGSYVTHNPIGVTIKDNINNNINPEYSGLDTLKELGLRTFANVTPLVGQEIAQGQGFSRKHQNKMKRFGRVMNAAPIMHDINKGEIPWMDIGLSAAQNIPSKKIQRLAAGLQVAGDVFGGIREYFRNQPDSNTNSMPSQKFYIPSLPQFKETKLNLRQYDSNSNSMPSQKFHIPSPLQFKETNLNLQQ